MTVQCGAIADMTVLEIKLRRLRLRRGGRDVLRGLDWHLRPGQRWVLVGGNGAGKTQLLKLLAGSVWPEPAIPGAPPPRAYRRHGQWHHDTVDVQSEVAYVGPERQDRYTRYDWDFSVADVVATGCQRVDIPEGPLIAEVRGQAISTLRLLGIAALQERRFLQLSSGERRLVLLARALASRPALLLLDETLTHLDAPNQQRLLAWLQQAPQQGPAWVLSTHRRDHIPSSATHALVLRQGRVLAVGKLVSPRVVNALTRVLGRGQLHQRVQTSPKTCRVPLRLSVSQGELWLEGRLILREANLALHAGECWVITGENGSGKTALLRALYGDFPFALGSVVTRTGVKPGEPLQNFRVRCGFVAPQLQTDYPRQTSVLDTVLSGWDASYGIGEPPDRASRASAQAALKFWALSSWSRRPLAELSYGQARRVLFARAWIRSPEVLLLDEPLAGLDVRQRRLITTRIERARVSGAAIIMTTHHADEWPVNCAGELRIADARLLRVR